MMTATSTGRSERRHLLSSRVLTSATSRKYEITDTANELEVRILSFKMCASSRRPDSSSIVARQVVPNLKFIRNPLFVIHNIYVDLAKKKIRMM